MTRSQLIADLTAKLDELQAWFASRPYQFRANATPSQARQYDDRVRAEEALIARLQMLVG